MIRSLRGDMRSDLLLFADGLTAWGTDEPQADAAVVLVAETIVLLNRYLSSKFAQKDR
jgi:hypothetical protein